MLQAWSTSPHQFDPGNVFNQEIKIGKISCWLLNTEEQQMLIFFVFNQEIQIGKIGHWLLNMEEQQMPIFFEELVLLEDDVYFELAWNHPYVIKSAVVLIVLLPKREMLVLDYLHMNQCGPQNKSVLKMSTVVEEKIISKSILVVELYLTTMAMATK